MDKDAASGTSPANSDPALYATFPRRLNALSADSVILIALSVGVFLMLPVVEAYPPLRILLILAWFAVLILYDPITVSMLGGTPGHSLLNLHVVDDQTGGRIGFGKALGRVLIKGVLGVFSFFTMAFSRRHRAIHDMVTGSTVRIRNPARAQPHHYVIERPDGRA